MKFFSLALVATLACAVAVFAAPRPEEFALGSFGKIFQQIKERMQQFKCASSVVVKTLADGGLKEELHIFKEFGEAIATDIFMCNLAGSFHDYVQCELEVVKAMPEYFSAFIEKLSETHKEVADKIKEEIKTKCHAKIDLFVFEGEFDESNELETVAVSQVDELALGSFGKVFEQIKKRMQHFKCTSSVVVKALADGGLKQQLNEFKKFGEGIATDFVMCNLAESFGGIVKCQLEVVKAIPEFFSYFIEELSEVNKELADKIKKEIKTECDAKVELFAVEEVSLVDGSFGKVFEQIKKRMQHFKCTSSIVVKALTDGGLKNQLEEFKEFGAGVATSFFACNLAGSVGKIVKCQLDVVKEIPEVFLLLIEDISEDNKELADKIKEQIKTKCDAKPESFASEGEFDVLNQLEVVTASQVNELALGSFGKVFQQIKERMQHFKCTSSVVFKALADGGLKDQLNDFKKFGKGVATGILMCNLAGSVGEIVKCQHGVVKAIPPFFASFIEALSEVNKELADKIKKEIKTKCDAKVELFAFEEASLVDGSFGNIFQKIKERMQQFKCTSSIVVKALADGGLKNQLEEFKEFSVGVTTSFFMCNLAGGVGKIVKCQLDVVKKIPEVFALLIEDISEDNKELADKIKEEIKTKCDAKAELLAFEEGLDKPEQPEKPHGIVEKLKCTTGAISAAVKDTGFAESWEEYKKDLTKSMESIKTCKTESSKWKVVKCTAKEVAHANELIFKFFSNVVGTNHEAVKLMRTYIKQRCFA